MLFLCPGLKVVILPLILLLSKLKSPIISRILCRAGSLLNLNLLLLSIEFF